MREPGVYILQPKGRLDSDTYRILEQHIEPMLATATKTLIFDMTHLDYISIAGIRILVKTKKDSAKHWGGLSHDQLEISDQKGFEIINAIPHMGIFGSIDEIDQYLELFSEKQRERK